MNQEIKELQAYKIHRARRKQRAQMANDLRKEFLTAVQEHGDYASLHEGYAVLLEEVDELWEWVKKKERHRRPIDIYNEAIQIAACALKIAEKVKL